MQKLTTKEQWLEWLQKIHAVMEEITDDPERGRYETVASLFGIVTYDSGMDEALVRIMMPTLIAIGEGTTSKQTYNPQNHLNFCITVNMPLLKQRLSWGTSIRGAWYSFKVPFDPHHGLVGTGSSGFDIIDAAPIGAGEEASFIQLIAAVHHFLQVEQVTAVPEEEVERTLYLYWCQIKERGIHMDGKWKYFPEFQTWSMANGYQVGRKLIRQDKDKGYVPDNCTWQDEAGVNAR